MKIGIFADIHGNIYAFDKVWKALQKERCDTYLFAGDICGYYYYQNEVIDILKGMKNLTAVRGNHDEIFLKLIDGGKGEEEYREKYGEAARVLKDSITRENLGFLRRLPDAVVQSELGIAVFHGSPWDHLDEYVYPDDPLERFEDVEYRIVILGHTHWPMDRSVGAIRVINPGSCGQPRDTNQPCYAMMDTETGDVRIKRVPYDVDALIHDVMKRGEKTPYLTEVLRRR